MEDLIRDMITRAERTKDYELAENVYRLLEKLAITYNCPSDWRVLGERMAEEYEDNRWVTGNCRLYDFNY